MPRNRFSEFIYQKYDYLNKSLAKRGTSQSGVMIFTAYFLIRNHGEKKSNIPKKYKNKSKKTSDLRGVILSQKKKSSSKASKQSSNKQVSFM